MNADASSNGARLLRVVVDVGTPALNNFCVTKLGLTREKLKRLVDDNLLKCLKCENIDLTRSDDSSSCIYVAMERLNLRV